MQPPGLILATCVCSFYFAFSSIDPSNSSIEMSSPSEFGKYPESGLFIVP